MREISEKILKDYQVRKTKKQKLEFIEFMKSNYPELRVEEGGMFHNRNIVIGDIDKAKVVYTAHYDTCARLPFPNIILPKNIPLSFLYAIVICIPFLLVMYFSRWLMSFVTENVFLQRYVSLLMFMLSMVLVMFFGIPNKHTANDNTSGVITLCELMASLPKEELEKCAFVFFDNEENGCLGSSYFRKLHKKQMADKLLVNFDCVGDGDNIIVVLSKLAYKQYAESMEKCFADDKSKRVWIEKSSNAYYPSDQAGFTLGVGVAALKGVTGPLLYMNRIHTHKDVICDEDNIRFVTEGFVKFTDGF